MTDLPQYLAADLELYTGEQVSELVRDSGCWIVRTASGSIYTTHHLILTAPLPQALNLLDTSGLNCLGAEATALRAVRYEQGLATLAILDGPSGLANYGACKVDAAPLTWIGDNTQKGISPAVHALTLHATPEFAAAHWDSPDEVRGPLMLAAAQPYLQAKVVEYNCHRWGFTQPINPWSELYYHNRGLQLTLAGDSFGGPRIEGAARSGLAAAKFLLES
jgi:predicted NAD/FAD-dependent oxidoreductase